MCPFNDIQEYRIKLCIQPCNKIVKMILKFTVENSFWRNDNSPSKFLSGSAVSTREE